MSVSDDDDDDLESLMYDLSGYMSEDSEEEDNGVTGWVPVTGKPVRISIDGVDQRLLATAREEVPMVLARIKKKLFGNRRREIRKVSAGDFLKAWMDPSFLGILQLYMNSNMPSNSSISHVSESDISSFIRVELFLSFYKVSADLYFNKEHSSEFPSAALGMSHKKYALMLVALGGTKGSTSKSSGGIWLPPMSHNSHVAAGMEQVRKICSSLAFIPGTSLYWDRGYGGTDGEVNTFAMETGADLIGTAKRMNSFPYTFDQQKVGTRQKI